MAASFPDEDSLDEGLVLTGRPDLFESENVDKLNYVVERLSMTAGWDSD